MRQSLDVILTVDWEGVSLEESNLERIRQFKSRYQVPFVHYVNPAYFTRSDATPIQFAEQIKSCIFEDDEWALHLHSPRHFVEATGVNFRTQPCFSVSGDNHTGEMWGQEVMLHAYTAPEFEKFLKAARKIFSIHGLTQPKAFRAGGWMLSPEQLEVLCREDFICDSSASPAQWLNESCWQGESLHRYLKILWGDVQTSSDPWWTNSVLEVPNNLGAIDYWKADQIPQIAIECISFAKEKGNHVAVLTAHQETACAHFEKLEEFMDRITHQKEVEVRFMTNRELLH